MWTFWLYLKLGKVQVICPCSDLKGEESHAHTQSSPPRAIEKSPSSPLDGSALFAGGVSARACRAAVGHLVALDTPKYLLVRGPYTFTRNPIYLSLLAIWFGWALFYGSVAVCVGCVVGWVIVTLLVVPWEERELEARFGEAYLRYKNTVPRWLGRTRR